MGSWQQQVGPYQVPRLLGQGGMGAVHEAVDGRTGQRVALKLLFPEAAKDPQRVARFLNEARALAQVEHPGVVRILHWDEVAGTAFLAMELLQGVSLREWMRNQGGPAPLRAALALGEQTARIMEEVHARGVVHRDLKPENIFLCPDGETFPGYRLKLLDFGIAKLPPLTVDAHGATQLHTHETAFMGTVSYMAPEQFLSTATVSDRADVYALGMMLFEMLAGRLPFAAGDTLEVAAAHLREEPPSLRRFVPTLPGGLSKFIASMLAKDPAERPGMRQCREMFGKAWSQEQEGCPVPGLAPFTEAQSELFFGRDEELQALLALLEGSREGALRWLQLEGPSGVGKSSLLQAGVLPRLNRFSEQGTLRWLVALLRPTAEPLRALARTLVTTYASTGTEVDEVDHALRAGPEALRGFITARTPPGCCLLLVLEPMEELFSLGAADSLGLDALLSAALTAPGTPLRLLTSLRSDFLHRLEHLPGLARLLSQATRYPLRPMGQEALTQVIRGMARHAQLPLSEGLAERMVQDARSEGGRLPLLGHALQGLWALSGGAPLTHEQYDRLGGVGGSLAQQAEELLAGLGPEGRKRAKWILLALVQLGRGTPDTRRPRTREEVLAAAGGDRLAEEVLLRLSGMSVDGGPVSQQGMRLIVLSGEADSAQQRVDLVHEVLLRQVPSLAQWLEQERTLLERLADLEAAARAWEQAQCPVEGLPTGTLLAYYREGAQPPLETGFLARRASPRALRFLQAADRLHRRRSRQNKGLLAAAVLAVLAILFYATRAEQARRQSEETLQQYLTSADDFVGDSDWGFSRLPYTLDERQKMLNGFQKSMKPLLSWARELPEGQRMEIKLLHRLGDLASHDARLVDAEGHLGEAESLLRAALEARPWDRALLRLWALNRSKRGKVAWAQGHREDARSSFTEAVRMLEGPGGQSDDPEDDRRTLAVSLAELAGVELELGNPDTAAAWLDRAIVLHAQNPNAYNETLLALTLTARGSAALQTGSLLAAQGYLEQAFQVAQRSRAHAPAGDQYSNWGLATVRVELARLQVRQGKRQEAEENYTEAESLGRQLLVGEPPNKRYALVLAHALAGHEELLRSTGEPADALRAERCKLAHPFQVRDAADVRFGFSDCQGVVPGDK
ncbi:Serine/threonine protein kinase [Stigmatella aurantiaca]|uniref:Serine/threonine protein kinase n=1 Tax=Stigmatella aurantiaca TaxID=41 RepID=A0A1H7LBS2_STIAU|nr:serine/threonine-protein kinase [Stigmatella aurantiaca]SEK95787.1 Serine/threonine protein kinase [Stigmatella aurantiaca]